MSEHNEYFKLSPVRSKAHLIAILEDAGFDSKEALGVANEAHTADDGGILPTSAEYQASKLIEVVNELRECCKALTAKADGAIRVLEQFYPEELAKVKVEKPRWGMQSSHS